MTDFLPADSVPSRRDLRRQNAKKKSKLTSRLAVLSVLGVTTVAVPYVAHSAAESQEAPIDIFADEEAILSVLPERNSAPELISLESGAQVLDIRTAEVSSRSDGIRDVLPGCDPSVEVTSPNGELTEAELCTLWDGKTTLRADAAVAAAKLNVEFRAEFGRDMCITSGYRSYGEQARVYSTKPGLAAPPGQSNHGGGQALDLCPSDYAGEMYNWFEEKGLVFGWYNPDWAREGGVGPYEPWHWEFETVY